MAPGSPRWTGAPWTEGKRPVTWTARIASAGVSGRIETTSGPEKRPAGVVAIEVRYIGTLLPCSIWRTGSPAASIASSKEKEQPITKVTRSSRQRPVMSWVSSASAPSRYTL